MQLMLLQVKLQKSVEGTYLVKKETTNKAMRNIFRCFAITKRLSLCFEGQKTAWKVNVTFLCYEQRNKVWLRYLAERR